MRIFYFLSGNCQRIHFFSMLLVTHSTQTWDRQLETTRPSFNLNSASSPDFLDQWTLFLEKVCDISCRVDLWRRPVDHLLCAIPRPTGSSLLSLRAKCKIVRKPEVDIDGEMLIASDQARFYGRWNLFCFSARTRSTEGFEATDLLGKETRSQLQQLLLSSNEMTIWVHKFTALHKESISLKIKS